MVAVGADRGAINGLNRAERAGIPTFTVRLADFAEREDWDAALTRACAAYEPDLIVLAGFMKLVGQPFLDSFGGRCVNTHPALLPVVPRDPRRPRGAGPRGEGHRLHCPRRR